LTVNPGIVLQMKRIAGGIESALKESITPDHVLFRSVWLM